MIRILSLGGGVQSVCVARMSLDGELPPLDHVIFADTGAEWPETYETVEEIERACHNRGVGFHRVTCDRQRSNGNLFTDLMGESMSMRWSAPPLYIDNSDKSARKGQTARQCTGDYKTDPIDRKSRELCGVAPGSRGPKEVICERWLGISADEKTRMKASQWRWMRVVHPLIEGPRPMWREECKTWLRRNGYRVPVKSACWFCPYQSDRRWLQFAKQHPEMVPDLVALDHHLRETNQFHGTPYLHRSLEPIDRVLPRLAEMAERAPSMLDEDGFSNECHGVCGV